MPREGPHLVSMLDSLRAWNAVDEFRFLVRQLEDVRPLAVLPDDAWSRCLVWPEHWPPIDID